MSRRSRICGLWVNQVAAHRPEVIRILKTRGGLIATLPYCPKCASYALHGKNNIGAYECHTYGLASIAESGAVGNEVDSSKLPNRLHLNDYQRCWPAQSPNRKHQMYAVRQLLHKKKHRHLSFELDCHECCERGGQLACASSTGSGSAVGTAGAVSSAERMTAEVFWMTSKLSARSAALPWYRWM
jgi:hypothetical protein